ncbi:MAG: hypothetical protein JWP11_3103 [Frankiales bacterium]|nr:hypothetical protein [Frankiales bacterium]
MLAALALILACGAIAWSSMHTPVTRASTTPAGLRQDQLLAYEHAVVPIVQDGGRVIQDGMKPAIDDLQYRHIVPAPVIAQEAAGWLDRLASVRTRLAAVSAPPALQSPTSTFLTALDGYRAAAQSFRAAALAPAGAKRGALVARGVKQAETADRVYDQGAAVVQGLRHGFGLEPSPYFPDGTGG